MRGNKAESAGRKEGKDGGGGKKEEWAKKGKGRRGRE